MDAIVNDVRGFFRTKETLGLEWRMGQLKAIGRLINENRDVIEEALRKDLGVNEFWTQGVEINAAAEELKVAIDNVANWMKPEKVSTPLLNLPASSVIRRDPLGVVLIIGPWNYPFSLAISPLIAAIAAGNCAVVKPSEVSTHTEKITKELLEKYMDPRAIRVVCGGAPETTLLLKEKFDMIFYTGNGFVGRIVMRAAAEHLTPVVLELGGKSPVIVAPDCNLEKTIGRIVWAKWTMNVGQTCVCPDYILVTKANEAKFISLLKEKIKSFYGDEPKESPDYSRIINQRHTKRIAAMLDDPSIEVLTGGEVDVEAKYIAPTVVKCDGNAKLMQDEIFGPVLPIISVDSVEEAMEFVNARDKPLALYVYTEDSSLADRVLTETSSGGACVNDCCMHLGNTNLPFGGVGPSGMGAYHGKHGFDTFTHFKAVLTKYGSDPSLRFPPYTPSKLAMLARFRALDGAKGTIFAVAKAAAVAVAAAAAYSWFA